MWRVLWYIQAMKRLVWIILAAILIAGGGYAAWQSTQDKNTNVTTNPSAQNQPKDPSEGGKYLLLEEHKLRIPLADKIRNLKLGAITQSSYSQEDKSTSIIAHELDESWTCTPNPFDGTKGAIGEISITRSTRRAGPGQPTVSKQVGAYIFGFEVGGSNCTANPLYQELVDTFKTQFLLAEAY